MIRIDAVWLATTPLDMRAGTDSALAREVQIFGVARPDIAYLFANRRANRMKVLVHDGISIWLAARRLHPGHLVWPAASAAERISLSRNQLDALVLGLPGSRWVKAMTTPWTAETLKWLHPMRSSRHLFCEAFNPWMRGVAALTEPLATNRHPRAHDNPLIEGERKARDATSEKVFKLIFEHPEILVTLLSRLRAAAVETCTGSQRF